MLTCDSFFVQNYRDAFSGFFNHHHIVIKLSYDVTTYWNIFLLEYGAAPFFLKINSIANLFYKHGKQTERELPLQNHRWSHAGHLQFVF